MKPDTVLDFAVFQLTPTRTRCELLISANGASEKLASGLLKPFLAHLRAAEEQIAVGGYSIRLEPQLDGKPCKSSWFTKGTMQRFVRFVSTPEVLERVSNVETELIQLEEELCNYANEVDDQQSVSGSVVTVSGGGKSLSKQIKARKDGEEIEGENNETSRCRLIKAMESRHSVLQREQGMAFARAVAAGFDMDHLSDLLAFAEYFGAARLSEACHKFAALCKKQQEGGLWLDEMELVAAEAAYAYPESNGTGITIAPDGLAPLKSMIEASKAQDEKGTGDKGSLEAHQRQSSLSEQHYPPFPQMMGMPPGQMPPYGHAPPWMHFSNEQGFDPRFMPQHPYMNGNYGQMNPYWGVPPPAPYNNASVNGEAEEEEEEVAEKGKKTGRKSLQRRRTSSPLKKVQVGRQGKRSGMVLIRNINYITGSQEQPGAGGNKSRSTENESDESSEFETSSEIDQGGKQHYSDERSDRNKNKRRTRGPAATEISSESSHASANGKDTTDETYFSVPGRGLSSAGNSYSFDTESLPQQHDKRRSECASDDSYMLNSDGRTYGRNAGSQYGAEDQMKSSNLASKDGLVMPGRNQYVRYGSGNHDSELSFRRQANPDQQEVILDDSFIVPQRSGYSDTKPIGEAYQHHNRQADAKDDKELQDLFIVPSRPTHDTSEMTRRTLELEMPADQNFVDTKGKPESEKFEPEDIWILPERSVGKESLEKRWSDVNVEMEAMSAMQPKLESIPAEAEVASDAEEFYEQYHEQRDAKIMKESGPKKAEREARMRSLQDTLDKRKSELSSRFKATRSSILKSKREKEEAERKRIEEAATERRNRIAARSGGSTSKKSQAAVSAVSRAPTSSTAAKPLARALSSTTSNKEPSVRTRNPLSRSVPSLEVRKENAKPTAARPAGANAKTGEPAVKAPVSAAKTSTPATRKSIASVRELARAETLKASTTTRTTQKEASSILQGTSRSASSRSLKPPTTASGIVQERNKVPGNQRVKTKSVGAMVPQKASSTQKPASPAVVVDVDDFNIGGSKIPLEVPQIEAVSFEQAKDTPEVKMQLVEVRNRQRGTDEDLINFLPGTSTEILEAAMPIGQGASLQAKAGEPVEPNKAVNSVTATASAAAATVEDHGFKLEPGNAIKFLPGTAKDAATLTEAFLQAKASQEISELIEPTKTVNSVTAASAAAETVKETANLYQENKTTELRNRAIVETAKQSPRTVAGNFHHTADRSIPAAKPIPPDVEVIYVPHKQHKDSGLKKLLKIGRSLVRN